MVSPPSHVCSSDDDCTPGTQCDDGACNATRAAISSFASDRAAVTSGTRDGAVVQGAATLSWSTAGAGSVVLFANGAEVDLGNCQPTPPAPSCIAAGSISVSPTEDTEYVLAASPGDEPCASGSAVCTESTVTVAAVAPAAVVLSTADTEINSGSDVTVSYLATNAATLTIGVVRIEDGQRRLDPCALAGSGGGAPCELPADGDRPAASGDITFAAVGEPFTVAARAANGADDGLGDVVDGEVELQIDVRGAPRVVAFAAADATVQPGDTVLLSWTVDASTSVSLIASPPSAVAVGLEACTGVDAADGSGGCVVSMAAGAALGPVVLTMVASDGTRASAPAAAIVELGAAPVPVLTADPEEVPAAGGSARLAWTAEGATVARLEIDGTAIVDTDAGTGDADCLEGDAGTCEAAADAVEVAVTANATATFTAENDFGSAATSVQLRVAGTPAVTALALGGDDGLDGLAVADTAQATLTWSAVDAQSTTLEAAVFPVAGCADPDASWQAVGGFPSGASGSFGVDVTASQQCLRLSALGSAGQRTSAVLEVVRTPVIGSFDASDTTVARGDTIELTLQTSFATGLSLSVTPLGAALASDLDDCAAVDGTGVARCSVVIQPGTPLGDVTLTAVAEGARGTGSPPLNRVVSVGTAPTVSSFGSSPGTLSSAGDVTLAWTTSDGASLTIVDDGGGAVFSSSTVGTVAVGSTVVPAVSRTTTWTFTVDNPFGQASAQATTFYGPSFSSLTVNGEDALDGTASFVTGGASVSFTTADATGVEAFLGAVPGDGDCTQAGDYASAGATGASGTIDLGAVIRDRCLRVVATNAAAQSSTMHARLVDLPEITNATTAPDSVSRNAGGTVVVDLGVRGATTLDVVVDHLDAGGTVLSTEGVCTEASLNSGALSGSAAIDSVSCTDQYDGAGCVLLCRRIPSGTASLRYRIAVADEEVDQAALDTSGGQDVAVTP